MSSGRSLYDQRGKIYLGAPMVAYIRNGMLILRKYPDKITRTRTQRTVEHTARFTYISRAWTTLTEKEQAEWEAYSRMLYSASERMREEATGRRIGIIPRRRMPSTGRCAFIQANMLAYTVGITVIRRKAPFNTGFPPAPTNIALVYENGIARMTWDDPIVAVNGVAPTVKKVRIWTSLNVVRNGKRGYHQLVGSVDIPSGGVFTFSSIRISGGRGRVVDVPLADFASGFLYVQTDTVVADGEESGAVRSVGSNIDKKPIRNF